MGYVIKYTKPGFHKKIFYGVRICNILFNFPKFTALKYPFMKIEKLISIVLLCFILLPLWSQPQRSIEQTMPARQVHLDFHTSEYIPDIGKAFDKKQFQEALITGNVNQINIFAKGHHGYSYYPTKVGTMHPNLEFDLLGAQMEACHEIGIKCPFYFTVGWSVLDAELNPDWLIRNKDGSPGILNYDLTAEPDDKRPHYSWKCLDPGLGGPYHEFVKKNVIEICERYENLDGFWFDIYHIIPASFSEHSLKRMKAEGIDLDDQEAVEKSYALALKAHMKELRELITKYHPDATVFFNTATHVSNKAIFKERLFDMNTHAEMEDLPTSWGGYDKLPLEAKYHLGQGTPAVAMSGKFHKAWGEFGGFKHPDAIKYEAAAMISFGVSCNFGDQLHPSGEMDMETYRNIGKAYEYVEKIEDYGPGGIPVSKLGIWLSLNHEADQGLVNILLELHHDFIIGNENNLENLELLIIPGQACLSDSQALTINEWVKRGGKLIVFNEGAMDKDKNKFLIDIGGSYLGDSEYDFDYTVIEAQIGENIVSTPFLNYESGCRVKNEDGTVLAYIREPYFNRSYAKYSSHRETPYKLENSEFPAILRKGNVIFFAHQLDRLYFNHGVRLHRDLVGNAIRLLMKKPFLNVKNLPSSGRVSLLKQENKNRYIAHLLYSPALLRGVDIQVIEDFLPVPGVELELRVLEKVKDVYQIPGEKKLDFTQENGIIKVNIPAFIMHTGIVFNY